MKPLFSLLLLCLAFSTAALADSANASLTPVKLNHHKVQRHHAHKAVKHKPPKRHHNKV